MKKKNRYMAVPAVLAMICCACAKEPEIREVMADIPEQSGTETVTSAEETSVSVTTAATTSTAISTTAVSETVTETVSETTAETTTTVSYTYDSVTLPDVTINTLTAPVRNVIFNYDRMTPSEEYKEFYSKCVFVGDSICRGFEAYDILPSKQVCAKGNTAARNILEYTFRVPGYTGDLMSCLKYLNPEYIVFSMGMNDVNMTSAEKFCENYGYLLSLTENAVPNAKLIVCSVTPILASSTFTSNKRIDDYNETLKNYLEATGKWMFVDTAKGLKDKNNGLKERYNGGDGIHLSGLAYRAILYQIAERVLDKVIYDEDGNMIYLDAPVTEPTETSETSEIPETSETPETTTIASSAVPAESSEEEDTTTEPQE